MTASSYTQAEVDAIVKMHGEGWPSSVIGRALGRTAYAISGKIGNMRRRGLLGAQLAPAIEPGAPLKAPTPPPGIIYHDDPLAVAGIAPDGRREQSKAQCYDIIRRQRLDAMNDVRRAA